MTDRNDSHIAALITSPSSLSVDDLRDLSRRFPYFPLPAICLLKDHQSEMTDDEISDLRLHLAMITSDKKALFDLLSDRALSFASLYPPKLEQAPTSTETAIDTFFANYGSADPGESNLIERMIFNPIPSDYTEQYLLDDNENMSVTPEEDSLESRIDAFVNAHPTAPARNSEPEPAKAAIQKEPAKPKQSFHNPADDSLLSESLAKIFIRQGRYKRAYEIISNLSLNYPKKSIYFADQLRFLQKLIKIQEAAQQL